VLSAEHLPASIAIYTTVALVAFEGLAVTAAIPQLAGDLGGVALIPWVITGYLLTSGVATVVAGPLVDAVGTRLMFRVAVTAFTLAGTAAALAPSMPVLVALRLLQGAGGGLVIAVGLAAVGLVYPSRLVSRAYAANSTVWGVMGVAGPALAAFLLTALDWRWIFGVNLPLGLVSLVAGWRVLPGAAGVTGRSERRLDLGGALLVSAFTLASLVAVDELGTASIPWAVAAALAGFAYRAHARRSEHPIIRLEHIAHQPFSGLALGIALMLTGALAANVYLPLYVQGGRGGGSAITAWSVLFFTVGWTIGSNVAGRITERVAESGLVLAGFAATLPGLACVAVAAFVDAPLWIVFGGFTVAGMGVGTSTNAALTLLRAVSPAGRLGRATAAHQFMRNQGITFGAALGGAVILFVVAREAGSVEAVRGLLSGASGTEGSVSAAGIADGFAVTAAVGTVISTLGLPAILSLRRHLRPARAARRAG
jgi:MFS family permease